MSKTPEAQITNDDGSPMTTHEILTRHHAIVTVLSNVVSRAAHRSYHAPTLEPATYVNDIYDAYRRLVQLFGLR